MKDCLVVRFPKLPGPGAFCRVLTQADFFHEALSNDNRGVEWIHPKSPGALSFPFWLGRQGERSTVVVADPRLQNAFQSPDNRDNILLLRQPAATDLRLTYAQSRYHYRRSQAADWRLPSSPFFDDEVGGVGAHLLREVPRTDSALTAMAVCVGAPDREPDGWMNPMILRLKVRGDACARHSDAAAENDTGRVFFSWVKNSEPLGLLPGFSTAEAIRCLAWSRLLARGGERPLSAVERLVAGGAQASTPPGASGLARSVRAAVWPFVGLDALGGAFLFEGHGCHPRGRWQAPSTLSANGHWLAEYLADRWGRGLPLLSSSQWDRPTASSGAEVFSARRCYPGERHATDVAPQSVSTPRLLPRRTLSPLADPVRKATQERIAGSLGEFLAFARDRETRVPSNQGVVLAFLADLLDAMQPLALGPTDLLQRPWMRTLGEEKMAWDLPGLLDDLARRWVAPTSSLLFELPEAAGERLERYLDLCRSVPEGNRGLLWGLLRERGNPRTTRTLRRSLGWWNDWHHSLFDDGALVVIQFVGSGFTLGQSTMGSDSLGSGSVGGGRSPIRFSILHGR